MMAVGFTQSTEDEFKKSLALWLVMLAMVYTYKKSRPAKRRA